LARVVLILLTLLAVGAAIAGSIIYVKESREKEEARLAQIPAYVPLEQLFIPIFRNDQLVETRIYIMTLETREGPPLEMLVRDKPKVRQLFQFYLNAFATRRGPENLDNDAYVKAQLIKASDEYFHQHVVFDVLLQETLNRPAS
jgi:regulator of protease activity HflC (stomatin/prohibitin superfamily)